MITGEKTITNEDIMAKLAHLEAMIKAQVKPTAAAQSKRFYTVKEACDLLRVGRTKLDDMANRGEIRKIKRGSKVLFFAQEIETLIAKETRLV